MKPISELDLPRLLTCERHRIHLVGVAGSGMSGIAGLLLELGHEVTGSDKVSTLETDRLQRRALCAKEVCIRRIMLAPRVRFLGQTHTGTRAANISSRKATKAMGHCSVFILSIPSF